jgi:cytidylate kinase
MALAQMIGSDNGPRVIAVDGPSASGKGTVAARVAEALGFHYLDSGALYRLVAVAASRSGVSMAAEAALADLALGLDVSFKNNELWLNHENVSEVARGEETSAAASQVAAFPAVRVALLQRQRAFRQPPGLVADGRDMGSVVFPDATLKVFLTADRAIRAERRHKQLMGKGMCVKIATVVEELQRRDERDSSRPVAPLRHYPDARLLDTTHLSIAEAVETILGWYRERVGQ